MHRLDELGWLQFERLCALVLDLESRVGLDGWHGSAERIRRLDVDEEVRVPGSDRVLPGPVTVLDLWTRYDGDPSERVEEAGGHGSTLLLTNAEGVRAYAPGSSYSVPWSSWPSSTSGPS